MGWPVWDSNPTAGIQIRNPPTEAYSHRYKSATRCYLPPHGSSAGIQMAPMSSDLGLTLCALRRAALIRLGFYGRLAPVRGWDIPPGLPPPVSPLFKILRVLDLGCAFCCIFHPVMRFTAPWRSKAQKFLLKSANVTHKPP